MEVAAGMEVAGGKDVGVYVAVAAGVVAAKRAKGFSPPHRPLQASCVHSKVISATTMTRAPRF